MKARSSIADTLLGVEQHRIDALAPRTKLYAVILAIVNLFVAGLAENTLSLDPTGYSTSLFIFVHSCLYALLALSFFAGSSQYVLHRIRIFPVHSLERLRFVILGFARHPYAVALLTSNLFFLAILFRSSLTTAISAVGLFLLLMTCIVTVAAVVFLAFERRDHPAGIALVVTVFFTLIMLTGTLVFHHELFITKLPLLGWFIAGLQAAQAERIGEVTLFAAQFGIVLCVTLFVGKRVG